MDSKRTIYDLEDTRLYNISVFAEVLGVEVKRVRAIEARGGIRRAPFQGRSVSFSGAEIKRAVLEMTASPLKKEADTKVVVLGHRRRGRRG